MSFYQFFFFTEREIPGILEEQSGEFRRNVEIPCEFSMPHPENFIRRAANTDERTQQPAISFWMRIIHDPGIEIVPGMFHMNSLMNRAFNPVL